MADKYLTCDASREVFTVARDILGYDLLQLCTKGKVTYAVTYKDISQPG